MAQLIISERQARNAVILDLSGDLIFGEATKTLRQSLRHHISDGRTSIYLNLKGVVYLDSSGIGELISALTAINREGGEFKLLNPTDKVQQLLDISKLTKVFEIDYEDENAVGM